MSTHVLISYTSSVSVEEDEVMASVRRGKSLQDQQEQVQDTGAPQSQVQSGIFQFGPSLHSPPQALPSGDLPQASQTRPVQRIQNV